MALALALPASAAIDDAVILRYHAPAEGSVTDAWEPVGEGTRLGAPFRLRTGTTGRLHLRLLDEAALRLGGDSAVQVHSTEPPDGRAHRGLARIQLLRGHLHASAGPLDLWPPTDLRLNVGTLRLRVFGADVWAETGGGSDEICLLSGAVEILTPLGPERLDGKGDCLRWDGQQAQVLRAGEVGPLAGRLSKLEPPAVTEEFRIAILPHASGTPRPAVAGDVEADRPPPATRSRPDPPPPPPESEPDPVVEVDPQSARWSLVLASLPTRDAAEREAARLRGQGLDTQIDAGANARGDATYRLTYGAFYTREAAEQQLRQQRRQRGFEKAWLLQRP
jgi:hypothetical protein